MNVLAIDIGGTNIKILATGEKEPRKFPSGPNLSPRQMVDGVKKLAEDWNYDVVSIGYPGVVVNNRILTEPHNLAKGWVGFNFKGAFRRPVKIINDAAMQALGSYKKGQMLFLGLGTGLGSAMVVEGVVVPMELGHLSYRNGTYEEYVGLRGLKRLGKKKWRKHVAFGVNRLTSALPVNDVVIGGGNAKISRNCRPVAGQETMPMPSLVDFVCGKRSQPLVATLPAESNARNIRMTTSIKPLTKRPAWKALAAPYKSPRRCISGNSFPPIRNAASA